MRFIENSENRDRVIAGEMINMECGKKIYDHGQLIHSPGKHQAYPDIQHEGVRTMIKSNFGILFLDLNNDQIGDVSLSRWLRTLSDTIDDMMTESSEYLIRYNRLGGYMPIDAEENGFTLMKVKKMSPFSNTLIEQNRQVITGGGYNRVLWSKPNVNVDSSGDQIGKNRFTWFIYDINRLIAGVCIGSLKPNPTISMHSYFTIVYDPEHIFKLDGYVRRDIGPLDLKYIKKITPLHSFGEITEEHLEAIRACKRREDYRELDKLIKFRYHQLHTKMYPNYIPFIPEYRIIYSSDRLGSIELIRQLGLWKIYSGIGDSTAKAKIHGIKFSDGSNKPVYDVEFNQITIDNTLIRPAYDFSNFSSPESESDENVPTPNDRCWHCKTPLYETIYLYIINPDSLRGVAVCSVCTHTMFSVDKKCLASSWSKARLYTNEYLIAKTQYPRYSRDVVSMVSNDLVRDVIGAMFDTESTKIINIRGQNSREKFVIFNYPFGEYAQRVKGNPLYIGYTDLSSYGVAWNTPNEIDLTPDQASVIWNSGTLFPVMVID